MSEHRVRVRARDPGQPRQPHRRGGGRCSRAAPCGRAAVPSGASTGEREAVELRDGDKKRYLGKGVQKAVAAVNDALAGEIIGRGRARPGAHRPAHDRPRRHAPTRAGWAPTPSSPSPWPWPRRPRRPPGQPLYRYVGGANARTLPVPFMNIINGGAHADNKLDPQEFMIVPHGAPSFAEALRMGVEVFHHLKAILKKKGQATAVGDEGGFAPDLQVERGGAGDDPRGDPGRRLQAGHADLARPGRGRQRVPRGQEVRLQEVGRRRPRRPSRWSPCTRSG